MEGGALSAGEAMIKSELIVSIANQQKHMTDRDIELSINRLIEYMCSALSNGERIEIRGFGSFSLHYRPPRNAHNPKTGKKLVTVCKYTPHFKPGKELRERVNACTHPIASIVDSDADTDSE